MRRPGLLRRLPGAAGRITLGIGAVAIGAALVRRGAPPWQFVPPIVSSVTVMLCGAALILLDTATSRTRVPAALAVGVVLVLLGAVSAFGVERVHLAPVA